MQPRPEGASGPDARGQHPGEGPWPPGRSPLPRPSNASPRAQASVPPLFSQCCVWVGSRRGRATGNAGRAPHGSRSPPLLTAGPLHRVRLCPRSCGGLACRRLLHPAFPTPGGGRAGISGAFSSTSEHRNVLRKGQRIDEAHAACRWALCPSAGCCGRPSARRGPGAECGAGPVPVTE